MRCGGSTLPNQARAALCWARDWGKQEKAGDSSWAPSSSQLWPHCPQTQNHRAPLAGSKSGAAAPTSRPAVVGTVPGCPDRRPTPCSPLGPHRRTAWAQQDPAQPTPQKVPRVPAQAHSPVIPPSCFPSLLPTYVPNYHQFWPRHKVTTLQGGGGSARNRAALDATPACREEEETEGPCQGTMEQQSLLGHSRGRVGCREAKTQGGASEVTYMDSVKFP